LASPLGLLDRRAEVSVGPAASGGGTIGFLGPEAVDSPITGPMTPGCVAGREHAAKPATTITALIAPLAIGAARRALKVMALL
jgi:hypothetical protein